MKFNEKYEQIQRESDFHKLFKAFEEDIKLLISGSSKTVSFQLAYDHVFKLVKQNRQSDILKYLDDKVEGLLKQKMQGENISTKEIKERLQECKEIVKRISQVCLFLDLNHCQKTLKQPLPKRLNSILYSALTSNVKVLCTIAQTAFNDREKQQPELVYVLQSIDQIDSKQQVFEDFILPKYIQLVKKHQEEAASKAWKDSSLIDYIQWCKDKLEKEQSHVWERLAKKRRREGVDAAVACVYDTIVGVYKTRIYQIDQNKLFKQLTLPLLELFKYGKGKDVEGHIQWFMKVLEKKLNLISTEDNNVFIRQFCALYEQVTVLLKNTQSKFQINYRSVFTFEEWINNQKFNVPLRLNLFIDQRFRYNGQNSKQIDDNKFSRQIALVFKLVKQKNIFENTYRQMLVSRIVRSYLTYRVEQEHSIIQAMEIECGQQWSDKIKSITELYVKDRNKLMEAKKINKPTEENNLNLGALVPLVIHENSWPFTDKNSKISLHNDLLRLTSAFQKSYISDPTKQRLWWTSKAGSVLLSISFKTTKRLFLVSVDMANLLLYIQKGAKKLTSFVCQHGYSIDQVEEFVQFLTNKELILSQQHGNDYELSLAQQYVEGPLENFIETKSKKLEVKVMEELKADRKLMIEAILVKIMKGEKVCKREQLMEKSVPLVTQRGFKFNDDFVSKSIDRLVDKEFIRDFEDGTLGYIA